MHLQKISCKSTTHWSWLQCHPLYDGDATWNNCSTNVWTWTAI